MIVNTIKICMKRKGILKMETYKLFLIGGANRVTLVEHIIELVKGKIKLEIFSIEKDEGFYPISSLAKIIKGPIFGTEEFDSFLANLLKVGNAIPIVCMDKAIPSLAKLKGRKFGKVRIVVSSVEGAMISLNKLKTRDFCINFGIKHPKIYNDFSLNKKFIAKPIEGYGSKGIFFLEEFFPHVLTLNKRDYIIQEFIVGNETTHDLYITESGNLYAISRDRLSVVDGEVNHCIVRKPTIEEFKLLKKIAASGLFWGPLTVQTIKSDNGVYLIEINARLGGGVTASIFSGFPVIELYFKESIGLELPFREIKMVEMRRARRDFYRIINETEK